MSYRMDYHRGAEQVEKRADWERLFLQRLACSTQVLASGQRRPIKMHRSEAVQGVITSCSQLLKAVRVYLLSLGSGDIRAFERDMASALVGFENKLTATDSAAGVLAEVARMLACALQSVEIRDIIDKPLWESRLQLSALASSMYCLSNACDMSDTSVQVIKDLSQPMKDQKREWRGNRWWEREEDLAVPVDTSSSLPITPTRAAVAVVLLLAGYYSRYSSSSHVSGSTTDIVVSPSVPAPTNLHITLPSYVRANFARHTGLIVQPTYPHRSVVRPTLRNFWSTYVTDVQRCFDTRGTTVHNLDELVTVIANDQAAHRLFETVSALSDQHFTIWWTCEEVVIAPGVQTNMDAYITPRPVTIRLTR